MQYVSIMNFLSGSGNKGWRGDREENARRCGVLWTHGQKDLVRMAEEKVLSLSLKLEALIDNYGIKELLFVLLAVCWGKAAKAAEEGSDPMEWSELAVKLGAVIAT
jgi:hypothetical protein